MRNGLAASLAMICLLVAGFTPLWADADTALTNDEIVKMVKAGVSDTIIIQTIKSSKHAFDLTPNGIVALKGKGVSDPIVEAMQGVTTPNAPAPHPVAQTQRPMGMGVTLVEGTNRIQMQYSNSQGRAGFGKVKLALDGTRAKLRITKPTPEFEISLPANADPSGLVTLAAPEVKSDRREIAIAHGGLFSGSSGIPKDKTLALSMTALADGDGSTASYLKAYKVTPAAPLVPGEYFLVVQGYTLYDFGVDGTN